MPRSPMIGRTTQRVSMSQRPIWNFKSRRGPCK